MPRYVIVTFSGGQRRAGVGRSDDVLEMLYPWLNQVDYLADGYATPPRGDVSLRSQRVMISRVGVVDQRRHGSLDSFQQAVWRETLNAYRRAGEWAGRGGIVGIALDHGDRGVVQLAPEYALEASRGTLQMIWLAQQGRYPRDRLGPYHETILAIGRALRAARIHHVELLTCRIGAGHEGRDLINWMHVLWGFEVRALLGDLILQEDPRRAHYGDRYRAFVVPPGAPSTRPPGRHGGFYRDYSRSMPTSPDLWRISVPEPPPIDSSLIVPPLPSAPEP